MTHTGSTPRQPNARQIGHTSVPVRQTRTQSLRPGDTVLLAQKKCTVTAFPEKNHSAPSWRVSLVQPDGTSRVVCKPAGFTWAVLLPEKEEST